MEINRNFNENLKANLIFEFDQSKIHQDELIKTLKKAINELHATACIGVSDIFLLPEEGISSFQKINM